MLVINDIKCIPNDLEFLEKEIVCQPVITMIRSVISMIDEKANYPYYRISTTSVTTVEEIMVKKLYDKDIYDYLDTSMMFNNFRFYYIEDSESDLNSFQCISNTLRSKVSEENISVVSFFISKQIKNEEELLKLIVSIISLYIKCKFNASFRAITSSINMSLPTNTLNVSNIETQIIIGICTIKLIDAILDLKYSDIKVIRNAYYEGLANLGIDISSCVLKESQKSIEVFKDVFNYSIEENHDPGDYNNLIKKCYDNLLITRNSNN